MDVANDQPVTILLTLTINAHFHHLFPFLVPPQPLTLLLLAQYPKYLNSCPFFSPLTCTPFSGTTRYFLHTRVLAHARKRALQSENNGSARHVEPKAQSSQRQKDGSL